MTNTDKCTICGAVTTEKFMCKTLSNQKLFMASANDRIKWGLVYTKPFDDDKNEFITSGDTQCEYANYIKSAQDPDKYIVRIKTNKNFFVCTTRSGEGTNAKFDFNDPDQCDVCVGFNIFQEESVQGEELANDNEPSRDDEDEEKDNKPENSNGSSGSSGFRFSQNKNKMHKEGSGSGEEANDEEDDDEPKVDVNGKIIYRLTRQEKLNLIHPLIKDYITNCKTYDAELTTDKIEYVKIKAKEGDDGEVEDDAENKITVDEVYSAEDAVNARWQKSRCELHYDHHEEFISSDDCMYAKAKDKTGLLL